MHYQRLRTCGYVGPAAQIKRKPGAYVPCGVAACDRFAKTKGLCEKHYKRLVAHGDPTKTTKRERGQGCVDRAGYIRVNNRAQHRLVMSGAIGRPLRRDEFVHHKNGDRQDNRIENLELWSTMQPKGQRVEDKVEFAIEILRLYRPEVLTNEPPGQ